MGRPFWSGVLAVVVGLVILLAVTVGLTLAGVDLFIAWLGGWIISAGTCLGLGAWRLGFPWKTVGCLEIGGVLLSAFFWQSVIPWWWPLGLVVLGTCYLLLAEVCSGAALAGWRIAFAFSAPFLAGIGGIWELGQIIGSFILLAFGVSLTTDEAAVLNTSFTLSSLLLIGGALFWALTHRRLIALALIALLVAQLAVALVVGGTVPGDPSTNGLLAMALLVIALAGHTATYPLRLTQPALAPGKSHPFGKSLNWRNGWAVIKSAIGAWRKQEAWWLCLLLDAFALLFCLLAAIPVAGATTADASAGAPLLISLSAGFLLSLSVTYWRNTAWFLLPSGLFLGITLYVLGAFAIDPMLAWPLLYLIAALLALGVALWLGTLIGRAWALPLLIVAGGYGGLALAFAFQRQSPALGIGTSAALVVAAFFVFWRWRARQPARQQM